MYVEVFDGISFQPLAVVFINLIAIGNDLLSNVLMFDSAPGVMSFIHMISGRKS